MIKVEYRGHFLEDYDVADIAWCSTSKPEEEKTDVAVDRLIAFLSRHGHESPFHHPKLHLHITAPIFVLRQLVKHRVGVDWNEKSYRYVTDKPEFFIPPSWRRCPEKRMQGSGEVFNRNCDTSHQLYQWYSDHLQECEDLYLDLLAKGVAPEQARMVLPLSLISEVRLTVSLLAAFRIYKLRSHETAQKEIQIIANEINDICENTWPLSWHYLKKFNLE